MSSPSLPWQHGKRQLGWYINGTLRILLPNLIVLFILSLSSSESRQLNPLSRLSAAYQNAYQEQQRRRLKRDSGEVEDTIDALNSTDLEFFNETIGSEFENDTMSEDFETGSSVEEEIAEDEDEAHSEDISESEEDVSSREDRQVCNVPL